MLVGVLAGNGRIVGTIFYDGALIGDSYNETITPFFQHALNIEIFFLKKKKSEKSDYKRLSRI